MLRPAMPEIIGKDGDAYAFVVAVAKRAREISDAAEGAAEPSDDKPVRVAIDEFAEGRCDYKIVHQDHDPEL